MFRTIICNLLPDLTFFSVSLGIYKILEVRNNDGSHTRVSSDVLVSLQLGACYVNWKGGFFMGREREIIRGREGEGERGRREIKV
jgi:hypothetical protein